MSIHTAIGEPWSRAIILDALREAAEVSGRTVAELRKTTRGDKLTSQARQAAMWHAHKQGVSHSAIGRFFNRNHTTVMHAVKAAQARSDENSALVDTPFFKSTRSKT